MNPSINTVSLSPPLPFPVNALPASLFELACEIQRNTKAPWELIVTSLLGAISLACQGSTNVQVPNGISAASPISIYIAALVESGGGKSTVDKLIFKSFGEFEVKQAEDSKMMRAKFNAEQISWNIKKKLIEKSLEKALKFEVDVEPSTLISVESTNASLTEVTNSDFSEYNKKITVNFVEQLGLELAAHLSQEPARNRNVKLIYNNTSPAAILRSLYENYPSASLSSDEAGGVFNGQALADLSMINKLWEGGIIHVDRIDLESFILRDARLSLTLMIQPKVFQKYLDRRGDEARSIGLFARCFICSPISSVGSRYIGQAPSDWQHLPKFHSRITELLEKNFVELDDPDFKRPTLEFSPDAKQLWINAFNEVESYLSVGQYFGDISDYGAKFGENLARLAALFHYFSGETGDISYETTNRAIEICRWFMTEFKRLFSIPQEVPQEVADARDIENWLAYRLQANNHMILDGIPYVKKNDILRSGPNSIRDKSRINAALHFMMCNNRIRIVKFNKTSYVELIIQYFRNLTYYQQAQCLSNFPVFNQQMLPNF